MQHWGGPIKGPLELTQSNHTHLFTYQPECIWLDKYMFLEEAPNKPEAYIPPDGFLVALGADNAMHYDFALETFQIIFSPIEI